MKLVQFNPVTERSKYYDNVDIDCRQDEFKIISKDNSDGSLNMKVSLNGEEYIVNTKSLEMFIKFRKLATRRTMDLSLMKSEFSTDDQKIAERLIANIAQLI